MLNQTPTESKTQGGSESTYLKTFAITLGANHTSPLYSESGVGVMALFLSTMLWRENGAACPGISANNRNTLTQLELGFLHQTYLSVNRVRLLVLATQPPI